MYFMIRFRSASYCHKLARLKDHQAPLVLLYTAARRFCARDENHIEAGFNRGAAKRTISRNRRRIRLRTTAPPSATDDETKTVVLKRVARHGHHDERMMPGPTSARSRQSRRCGGGGIGAALRRTYTVSCSS